MTHLGRAHAWDDEGEMRAFVARASFAQICAVVDGRPMLAHAPLSVHDDGSIRFHLFRRNPIAPYLDGAAVVAGVVADDFYVSPDWYQSDQQVPTWNYRLVEISGTARKLDQAELRDQVEALSETQEALLAPKPVWRMDKLEPARRDTLLAAIDGFSIDAPTLRGAAKLAQNKSAADIAGVLAALRARGRDDAARAIEAAR